MKKIKIKKSNVLRIKEDGFDAIEDSNDLSQLEQIAAQATRKAFKKANKIAPEMVFAKDGNLIRKKLDKTHTVVAKLKERKVEVGQKIYI